MTGSSSIQGLNYNYVPLEYCMLHSFALIKLLPLPLERAQAQHVYIVVVISFACIPPYFNDCEVDTLFL